MDVATIRKFLHLLDLRKEDFAQELELQNIKGEITKKIRLTQGLEKDLDSMDIKIGKNFLHFENFFKRLKNIHIYFPFLEKYLLNFLNFNFRSLGQKQN